MKGKIYSPSFSQPLFNKASFVFTIGAFFRTKFTIIIRSEVRKSLLFETVHVFLGN